MLSNTCKTAIKAVIFLATKIESGDKAAVREISEYIGASEHTVGKLLQTLVKQGVLSGKQKDQPIINIVRAIDGQQIFKECGLGLSKCSSLHPCPIHDDYKQARDLIENLFENKKVHDLCVPVSDGFAYLIG
jgi:DNA-binding IscR family transcriptional regulator